MTDEIQLISDGDGLAVIGDSAAVDRFLISEGLPSTDLGLGRLRVAASEAAGVLQLGADVSAHSGRWVKLTQDSVDKINKYGLMKGSASNLSRGVVQAKGGQIKGIVQFVRGPGAALTSPALLAGAAGIMAQIAMQQAMEEITDYLAVIDAKVDDILRAQKDAVLADMIGVDLVIEEAMTVRGAVGRVSEITWSKVQGTSMTIARTQAYALRQLDALAEKLEKKSDAGDLARAAKEAESTAQDWLAVLARCFQLHDALAVLELDRVLDGSPEDLDDHRLGLRVARQNRLQTISRTTDQLVARLDTAAQRANTKVLLHPLDSRKVVQSSNQVAIEVLEFHGRLGIEGERDAVEARRWREAAADARDSALVAGGAVRAGVANAAGSASRAFQSIDLDGDGLADEARAVTAVKGAGGAVAGAASVVGGRVGGLFKRGKRDLSDDTGEL